MRVLIVHNRYKIAGGEDVVADTEKLLLTRYGHDVSLFEVNNDDISSKLQQAKAALNSIYSFSSEREMVNQINQFSPDIVHVHNFFPLLSPSIYYACSQLNVPVVQTLHNYRLMCASPFLMRENRICEDCIGKTFPWPSIVHACYHDSHVGSASIATMIFVHRMMKTWAQKVTAYIALTDFSKQKFIQGGLPANKIFTKPNFLLSDPGFSASSDNYALFVGRLSEEKGLRVLIDAWKSVSPPMSLKIVGEGPLSDEVSAASQTLEGVEYLGKQPRSEVFSLMQNAHCLVFPSLWYEGLPMVILEAYAVGLPVVASNVGSMSTLIRHQHTGLHFEPGNSDDLASQIQWLVQNGDRYQQMRHSARQDYEATYSAEGNYKRLMSIYDKALSSAA